MNRHCCYLTLLLFLTCGLAGGAVTVTLQNVPASVTPGTNATVNVQYTRPSTEPEKRLVFIVEFRETGTNSLIVKAVQDNNLLGYSASSGAVPFTVAIPAGSSGSGYFLAYAVPWSMNRAIVAHYKTYPTNGTFTYLWAGGGYGVTQNVYYLSTLICPKPSGNTTYCSGLAFEACVIPFNAYNLQYGHARIGNMTASQMGSFRLVWYGVTDAEKLAARAIPEYGIGVEITDFEEAQEGDFVQLWRHSGSGHNPVFVNWLRNSSNQITGVRYWGSQGSSNGIGYNQENFGTSTAMNRNRFYIGRLRKPRDQADYDWALGNASSASSPTLIGTSAVGNWMEY